MIVIGGLTSGGDSFVYRILPAEYAKERNRPRRKSDRKN